MTGLFIMKDGGYNKTTTVTLRRKISHNAENEQGNRSSTKLKLTNLLFYT